MFRFPFPYFLFLLLGRNCSHFGNSTFLAAFATEKPGKRGSTCGHVARKCTGQDCRPPESTRVEYLSCPPPDTASGQINADQPGSCVASQRSDEFRPFVRST